MTTELLADFTHMPQTYFISPTLSGELFTRRRIRMRNAIIFDVDGTLANELAKINCRLLVVAVGGSQNTNGKSFRGDSQTQWQKMITPMKAGAIMTNHP